MQTRPKDEWRRSSTCEGKHRFDSPALALKLAKKSRQRRDSSLQAYHCQFCGGWHVGAGKPKPARKKRMTINEGEDE